MPTKIPLEREYAFVLSCLQSSLNSGGKIDFNAVARQHNTTATGAQQRIRRCQKSAGLVADEPKENGKDGNVAAAASPVIPAKPNVKRVRPAGKGNDQGGNKKRKLDKMLDRAEDDDSKR